MEAVQSTLIACLRHRSLGLLVLCTLGLTGILFLPLIWGFPMGFDLSIHLSMLHQFCQEIREGNLFPAWLGGFNRGLGDPTMIFYPPGFYYLGSLFSIALGWGTAGGLFGALFLLTAVCLVGMFFLVRPMGGAAGGLVGMGCLLLVPFRTFAVHSAGMYPAYAAGCILPFALLSLWKLSASAKASALLSPACLSWACCLAVTILLNLPFALLLLHLVVFWALLEAGVSRDLGFLVRLALGTLWGLLLSAFYLIPMAMNLSFVRPPFAGIANYRVNFPSAMPPEVFGSEVPVLFSMLTLFPFLWLAVSIATLLAIRSPSPEQPAEGREARSWVRMHMVFALGAYFLLSPASRWLWDALPLLQKANVPWRLLDHAAVPAAALQALALTGLWRRIRLRPRRWVPIALLILAPAGLCGNLAFKVASANGFVSQGWVLERLPGFLSMKGDYLPRWASREGDCSEGPPVRVLRGDAKGRVRHWGGSRREIEIQVETPALLEIQTFEYPGWEAELQSGGEKTPVPIDREVPCGRITLSVPPGSGILRLKFGRPMGWQIGAWASGAALTGFALWALLRLERARKRQSPPRSLAPPCGLGAK